MKNITAEEAAKAHENGLRVSYNTPGNGVPAILRTVKAGYPQGEPRFAFFYEDRSIMPDSGTFLDITAAGAIRMAMNNAREVYVQEVVPVSRVVHPPEPVKPREFWIAPTHGFLQTAICIEKPVDAEENGYFLFREVTPATGKQYHVWVNEQSGDIVYPCDVDEYKAREQGYRKAVLMEVQPSSSVEGGAK